LGDDGSRLLYLLIAAGLNCIYISLLSSTKIVLGQVEHYKDTLKGARNLYIVEKIEEFFENKTVFAMIISFAKSSSVAVLGVIIYFIARHYIFPIDFPVWKVFVKSAVICALIVGFFCYSIPRAFALRYAESLLIPVYFFYSANRWFLAPVGLLMNFVQSSLLKFMKYDEKYHFLSGKEFSKLSIGVDNSEEGLNKEGKEMIRNIFEFGDTTAKEVMVPRIDIVAIPANFTLKETLDHISQNGHSRVPVFENTIDSIIGFLYVKDVVIWLSENGLESNKEWSLKKLIKEPYYIPASKKLDDLMADMKKMRYHIAVVVDEYGGTAGLLTLEDLLEEIVGDIHDEYDKQIPSVVKVNERTFLVNPHIELDDLTDAIPINLGEIDEKEYNTLGGLFYHEYGNVPSAGTEFSFKGTVLKITKMNAQKIEEIQITLSEDTDTAEMDNQLSDS